MRVYTSHRRGGGLFAGPEWLLVKDGFCWPAFFLTFIWALWHRMWIAALLILGAELLLGAGAEALGATETTATVLTFAAMLVIGWGANDWRRASLARRGYDEGEPVAGTDLVAAELRYLSGARLAP